MTSKGQMKPTSWQGELKLTASQTWENRQSNDPEHKVLSSILTDLIFTRNHGRREALSEDLEPSSNREEVLESPSAQWTSSAQWPKTRSVRILDTNSSYNSMFKVIGHWFGYSLLPGMPLNSSCKDVGFICPFKFVVIDPTDLGATPAVARNLLQD